MGGAGPLGPGAGRRPVLGCGQEVRLRAITVPASSAGVVGSSSVPGVLAREGCHRDAMAETELPANGCRATRSGCFPRCSPVHHIANSNAAAMATEPAATGNHRMRTGAVWRCTMARSTRASHVPSASGASSSRRMASASTSRSRRMREQAAQPLRWASSSASCSGGSNPSSWSSIIRSAS